MTVHDRTRLTGLVAPTKRNFLKNTFSFGNDHPEIIPRGTNSPAAPSMRKTAKKGLEDESDHEGSSCRMQLVPSWFFLYPLFTSALYKQTSKRERFGARGTAAGGLLPLPVNSHLKGALREQPFESHPAFKRMDDIAGDPAGINESMKRRQME